MSKVSGGKVSAMMNYFPNRVKGNAVFHNRSNVILIEPKTGTFFMSGTFSEWSKSACVCFKHIIYSVNIGMTRKKMIQGLADSVCYI